MPSIYFYVFHHNSILTSCHPDSSPFDLVNSPLSPRSISGEGTTRKVNPARWKPPATSYWTHSVYCYNKNTTKTFPVTADITRKTLRAYFNMLPRDFNSVLHRFRAARGTGPSLFKAFVSDRGGRNPSIKQHLIGKISPQKNSFWRPFRRLMEIQPKIVFKHYPYSETRIMVLVYDRRIESLKQRLLKLSRRLDGQSQSPRRMPGAFTNRRGNKKPQWAKLCP